MKNSTKITLDTILEERSRKRSWRSILTAIVLGLLALALLGLSGNETVPHDMRVAFKWVGIMFIIISAALVSIIAYPQGMSALQYFRFLAFWKS